MFIDNYLKGGIYMNWIKPEIVAEYAKMDLVANEQNGDWMQWIYTKTWNRG